MCGFIIRIIQGENSVPIGHTFERFQFVLAHVDPKCVTRFLNKIRCEIMREIDFQHIENVIFGNRLFYILSRTMK